MCRFSAFLKSATPVEPQLPLVHTCDVFGFQDILKKKELTPTPCDVFEGETLVYLFYGRPAYRPASTKKATSLLAFMPVSIVLDPEVITDPKRIAPFDTGAFDTKLFAKHMHPKMSLDKFLLEPFMDMPARLVSKFFESNRAYFHAKPASIDITATELEAVSYYSLINDSSVATYDDRASAIEIQTERPLTLTEENVLLVVLPAVCMDTRKYADVILTEWGAKIRTYSIQRRNPSEYMSQICEGVADYYTKERYF